MSCEDISVSSQSQKDESQSQNTKFLDTPLFPMETKSKESHKTPNNLSLSLKTVLRPSQKHVFYNQKRISNTMKPLFSPERPKPNKSEESTSLREKITELEQKIDQLEEEIKEIKNKPTQKEPNTTFNNALKEEIIDSMNKNKRIVIKSKIKDIIRQNKHSTNELKKLIVEKLKYCSRATFYRYMSEMKRSEEIQIATINEKEIIFLR